jgi:hypothetical protein
LAMNSSNTKPREERDAMYEIQIRMLHKAYKEVFKQLYTINMSRLPRQE